MIVVTKLKKKKISHFSYFLEENKWEIIGATQGKKKSIA